MFTIYKGNQNIVQETLTDKAVKVRALLREADAVIIGAGAGLSTAAGIEYRVGQYPQHFRIYGSYR